VKKKKKDTSVRRGNTLVEYREGKTCFWVVGREQSLVVLGAHEGKKEKKRVEVARKHLLRLPGKREHVDAESKPKSPAEGEKDYEVAVPGGKKKGNDPSSGGGGSSRREKLEAKGVFLGGDEGRSREKKAPSSREKTSRLVEDNLPFSGGGKRPLMLFPRKRGRRKAQELTSKSRMAGAGRRGKEVYFSLGGEKTSGDRRKTNLFSTRGQKGGKTTPQNGKWADRAAGPAARPRSMRTLPTSRPAKESHVFVSPGKEPLANSFRSITRPAKKRN